MINPSISVSINPNDQTADIAFDPQRLTLGQYGVVLSLVVQHIAKVYCSAHPERIEDEVIAEILAGLEAGMLQRQCCIPVRPN